MVTMTKNMDGTIEWKSSKIKELFEDFDGTVDDRIVTGKAGDHRTQAITFKPNDSTEKLEIIGVNEDIEIDFNNRKNVDVQYVELRGAVESTDEGILIANAIIRSRLINCGYRVEDKDHFKRKWVGTGYPNNHY